MTAPLRSVMKGLQIFVINVKMHTLLSPLRLQREGIKFPKQYALPLIVCETLYQTKKRGFPRDAPKKYRQMTYGENRGNEVWVVKYEFAAPRKIKPVFYCRYQQV